MSTAPRGAGNNFRGTLGIGTIYGGSWAPVSVTGGLRFVALSSGSLHTVWHHDGPVRLLLGINLFGQVGQSPTMGDVPAPIRVDLPPQ